MMYVLRFKEILTVAFACWTHVTMYMANLNFENSSYVPLAHVPPPQPVVVALLLLGFVVPLAASHALVEVDVIVVEDWPVYWIVLEYVVLGVHSADSQTVVVAAETIPEKISIMDMTRM